MNQIKLIKGLPNWHWKENSRKEMDYTNPDELVEESDFIWRIGRVVVAGFIYTSYTSPPWMWFLLAEEVKFSDLLDFRRLATMIPTGTLTTVALDYTIGFRFAKFYGFIETKEVIDHGGRSYRVMRKV